MVSIAWIIVTIILNLQMKSTISKYGSIVHNKFKPILCILGLIPIAYMRGGVYLDIRGGLLMWLVMAMVMGVTVTTGMAYNKMIEKTPMSVMNVLYIITAVETFLIDMSVGRVSVNYLIILWEGLLGNPCVFRFLTYITLALSKKILYNISNYNRKKVTKR